MNAAIKFNRLSTGRYISACGSDCIPSGGFLHEWDRYFLPVKMKKGQNVAAKNSRIDMPLFMVEGFDTYGSSKRAAAKLQTWIASGKSHDTFCVYR